jgi:hypothetical protein
LFGLIVTEKAQLVGSRCGKLCLFVLFRGTWAILAHSSWQLKCMSFLIAHCPSSVSSSICYTFTFSTSSSEPLRQF